MKFIHDNSPKGFSIGCVDLKYKWGKTLPTSMSITLQWFFFSPLDDVNELFFRVPTFTVFILDEREEGKLIHRIFVVVLVKQTLTFDRGLSKRSSVIGRYDAFFSSLFVVNHQLKNDRKEEEIPSSSSFSSFFFRSISPRHNRSQRSPFALQLVLSVFDLLDYSFILLIELVQFRHRSHVDYVIDRADDEQVTVF